MQSCTRAPARLVRAAARAPALSPRPALRFASSSSSSSSSSPSPADPHPYLSQLARDGATRPGSSTTSGPNLGPFPLPPNPSRDERIAADSKRWRQLGVGGKAKVAATQGASLVVVLGGATLFVLVVYAFGTELFSEASPTRIFEDCVERVKHDEELLTMLAPPLSFHGSASSSRMRRNRRIQHSLTVDPRTGLETLFVRFYVEGSDPLAHDALHGADTWLDWAKRWIGPAVWDDSSRPGAYQPRLSSGLTEHEEEARLEAERRRALDAQRAQSWGGWVAGGVGSAVKSMFGGVRGLRGAQQPGDGDAGLAGAGFFRRQRKPRLGEYTTGEVVAELQKDPSTGHFVYQQLFVALPDTRHSNYYRHNISTATVVPSEEKGLDRFRFWNRTKVVAA
ncbi:uncharacterized protein JCM10292_004097 [Rhodotorula paludigena]|uniref:uncharacterized protein n=1 Tax=Rhodotorula paludigena TaxID=86838 RepID=UPI00316CB253